MLLLCGGELVTFFHYAKLGCPCFLVDGSGGGGY
jgi:hypothetical protein